jgi:hypothetical protein
MQLLNKFVQFIDYNTSAMKWMKMYVQFFTYVSFWWPGRIIFPFDGNSSQSGLIIDNHVFINLIMYFGLYVVSLLNRNETPQLLGI